MRLRSIVLGMAAAASVAGVAGSAVAFGVGVVPGPRDDAPLDVTVLSASGRGALEGGAVAVARDSIRRHAKRMTVRVRNVSCFSLATGSGFALDRHTVVTNRHVIAGAEQLQLSTWDGRSLRADVGSARTARLVDIGIAKVGERLPAVAKLGPPAEAGDRVTAVGFPLGGSLTLSPGHVLSYRDGRDLPGELAFPGRVMEVTTKVKHGNSGGPLLDEQGRVVGIIYAGEPGISEDDWANTAYAIPIEALDTLVPEGGERAVVPCEE
jgi:S1-C subfamily serine protease